MRARIALRTIVLQPPMGTCAAQAAVTPRLPMRASAANLALHLQLAMRATGALDAMPLHLGDIWRASSLGSTQLWWSEDMRPKSAGHGFAQDLAGTGLKELVFDRTSVPPAPFDAAEPFS